MGVVLLAGEQHVLTFLLDQLFQIVREHIETNTNLGQLFKDSVSLRVDDSLDWFRRVRVTKVVPQIKLYIGYN